MNARSKNSKNNKSFNFFTSETYSIIRSIPGIVILLYAYLYIIGYFYLSSYFREWGLPSLGLGFTIVDYATVAIYPIFFLSLVFLLSSFVGYVIYNKKLSLRKDNKLNHILNAIAFLISLIAVLAILMGSSFSEWGIIMSFFTFFSYLCGILFAKYKFTKDEKSKKLTIILILLIILIVLLFTSIWVGKDTAEKHLSYSYPFLGFPELLPKVIVTLEQPLDEWEIFKTEENKYEGFMLLIYKNDVYYFIADIYDLDKFTPILDQKRLEINKIKKEMDLEKEKMDADFDEQNAIIDNIEIKHKEVDEDLKVVKKNNLTVKERKKLLQKIYTGIDAAKQMIKKYYLIKSKEKLGKYNKLLESYNDKTNNYLKASGAFLKSYKKTFAIKKEKIKYITYLKEER